MPTVQDYIDRLNCKVDGDAHYPLYTLQSSFKIATGYNRISIGDRGPYVELLQHQLIDDCFEMPMGEVWRLRSENAFYIEYRTIRDYVKIYHQLKPVGYADYIPYRYYVSPFDLCDMYGTPLITKLSRRRKNNS